MKTSEKVRLELLEDFRRGTSERIGKINLAWISLEENPENNALGEELARQLHTIKGESKMMGFADVSLVAHRAEELVMRAKEQDYLVSEEFGDLILAATDAISLLISKKAGANQGSIDLPILFDRFDRLLEKPNRKRTTETRRDPAPPVEGISQTSPEQRVTPDEYMRVNTEVVDAFTELASEAVIKHSRYDYAVKMLQKLVRESQVIATDVISQTFSSQHIENMKMDDQVLNLGRSAVMSSPDAISIQALTEVQVRLVQVTEFLKSQVFEGAMAAKELEHKARQLRLEPIGSLLNKYIRVVRDLAAEHGKVVVVEVQDEGVSLDKNVVDRIAEPLLHLVRNSIDHGLETPEERERVEKPKSGKITLSAKQEGGYVTVVIEDDGRGIDEAGVRSKAVCQGILSREGAESLTEGELLGLLFRPGFSTRKAATETSGRGVGLDVVKRQVEILGGNVSAHSVWGQGTRFELRVPVSVALTRVLVINVGGNYYGIPSRAVDGVTPLDGSEIELVHNRRSIRFRGKAIPLVDLASIIGYRSAEKATRAVVVHQNDSQVAMEVVNWHTELETIVKPLGDLLKSARLFTGACTLEEAGLALVFNPSELVSLTLGEAPKIQVAAANTLKKDEIQKKQILLAEDSTITRTMISRLLSALGYAVIEAENGIEALERLQKDAVDLLLTDIDMPQMNGIELIEHVRENANWRNLPIVVLSTRGSEEDKKRGVEAGADSYLVKTEFSEQALRDALEARIGI